MHSPGDRMVYLTRKPKQLTWTLPQYRQARGSSLGLAIFRPPITGFPRYLQSLDPKSTVLPLSYSKVQFGTDISLTGHACALGSPLVRLYFVPSYSFYPNSPCTINKPCTFKRFKTIQRFSKKKNNMRNILQIQGLLKHRIERRSIQ